jgi:hypothetical protein
VKSARELNCDEDPAHLDKKLKKVAPQKRLTLQAKAKPKKRLLRRSRKVISSPQIGADSMPDFSTAFTVQIDPNVGYWPDGKKIYWHYLVPATSPEEAVRIIQLNPSHKGMPARVVPRLG